MSVRKPPVMLMILDGFGMGDVKDPMNAVASAHPEHILAWQNTYPTTTLEASGLDVGLPQGQMGNSEVGHLNIGAGRIVYQELTRITKDVEEGTFYTNPVLKEAYQKAKGRTLHIIGLLSDGGVHSHISHIEALVRGAKERALTDVVVHAVLDGRDVPPSSALGYVETFEHALRVIGVGKIGTISGRFYAMDRDTRWERVEKAYDAIALAEGLSAKTAEEAVKASYQKDETDEFVQPTVVGDYQGMQEGDVVIFANFRPDRARELTKALSVADFAGFTRKGGFKAPYMVTMTPYEEGLPVEIIYKKELLTDTLGEILAKEKLRQVRIAETEKYAHVTYFFNGGREETFEGEHRVLIPSPKVATYDLKPEMSAHEVTKEVLDLIQKDAFDVMILNFANPDMVGHTGDFEAAKQAVKTVDTCASQIVEAMNAKGGYVLLTADHGNADMMQDPETKAPHTAHTTNPVPFIFIHEGKRVALREGGRLSDLAPTILDILDIEKPSAMTGTSLIQK